jgi:hypothetical protein
MNTSLSIFARALASENLSFGFDPEAETASFDVKQRHLTLPVWRVSETVQTMLIAHEISHALWTPAEESDAILKAAEAEGYNPMLLQRIANVVEDVRIEKMMKEKFPGTRRDFFLGYKEIVDSDLFGFSKMDFEKATLINRLNLHFKWGVQGFLPINLTNEEQQIADEIDSVTTFAEVYEVAKRLYDDPSMQKIVQEVEEQQKAGGKQSGESLMADAVKDFAPGGTENKGGEKFTSPCVTISPLKDLSTVIVPSSFLLKEFEERNNGAVNMDGYREFVRHSDAFVRQMVAQFERKKAADEIRRERPKQTGMLNLDRLHQYRTHDDIFISKIVKQDGKNHGMVFMLDFSGSMSVRLSDCILQLFQLVWFCEKAKIPFEVFCFTDCSASYIDGKKYDAAFREWQRKGGQGDFHYAPYHTQIVNPKPTSVEYGLTRLFNLLSSRDSAADRERMMAYLYGAFVDEAKAKAANYNERTQTPCCLSLHGTPTVEAIAAVSQFMQKWVAENKIQIPTLMVVTDGQPNGIYTRDDMVSQTAYYHHADNGMMTVMNEVCGTAHRIDLYANRGISLANVLIGSMLDSLRKTMNARIVGMFVGNNTLHETDYIAFCMSIREREVYFNLPYHERNMGNSPRFAAMREAYKEGAIICHPEMTPGYDSFFLVRTPKIVKDEDAIAESGTFTKIKNTFVKTMGKRAGSRVFLNRYVDIVAGQPIKPGLPLEYQQGISPASK